MPNVPLGKTDWFREVAKEARLPLRNRYFEQNPVLTDQQVALIDRPGLMRFIEVGNGPIRAVYSQPGSFHDQLFIVSYDELYTLTTDEVLTFIVGSLFGGANGNVSMAATGNIGSTPEYLFIADGRNLYVYIENGYARGDLVGTPANNDIFVLGSIHYKWTSGSVDAGTPAGTGANPWLIALGVDSLAAFTNAKDAINATGVPGTSYSTALLVANTQAQAYEADNTQVRVRALAVGIIGDGVVATETGAALAWSSGGATLANGGDPSVLNVVVPDDVGAISVAYIASYIVVIPAQGQGVNGRFYWINPGEIIIDPLDFATAERAPDPIFEVVVFGDQFWLPGQTTTEVWYFTGDIDAPVTRLQGITFDRGTWEGTAIQVKTSMIIVDSDGGVFQIEGGIKRVSNSSVEERIREAMQKQAALL